MALRFLTAPQPAKLRPLPELTSVPLLLTPATLDKQQAGLGSPLEASHVLNVLLAWTNPLALGLCGLVSCPLRVLA